MLNLSAIKGSLAAIFILVASSVFSAKATPLLWNFMGVTWSTGGTTTGSFMFDAAAGPNGTYSEINVINTGGRQDGAHYIAQNPSFTPPFNSRFRFVTATNQVLTGTPMLIAAWSASMSLTDAGGTIPFTTLAKSVCTVSKCAGGGNFQDQIGHGFLTTPEPASIALLGAALFGLAFIRRRG